MALQIIGAGFGRTGTESMKRALEILGYDPCYHMYEVIPHPQRYKIWQEIYDGVRVPDWDAVFDGFHATVDWPAARYWRELAAHYPEAKILLTVRSSESWYASMDKTVLTFLRNLEKTEGLGPRLRRDIFEGNVHDKDHVIAIYERNIAQVQAAFGADRLLTYELGSGWDPLCRYLGKPVPDVDFPNRNKSATFHASDADLAARRSNAGRG